MSWIKLDDNFADHPKILRAGPLASWLYVAGLCYCGRHLTDGFIPSAKVRGLADVPDVDALADRLVDVRLWERVPEGFQVHDYLSYNPPREKVEETRDERSEAGRAGGIRSGQVRRERASEAKTKQIASPLLEQNAKQNRTPYPVPVPVPVPGPDSETDANASVGADAPRKSRKLTANQEIWNALVDSGLPKPQTRSECSLWGSKTGELAAAGVQPAEISDLVRRYRAMWPNVACTLTAITSHLAEIRAWNGQVNGHARVGPNGRAVDRSVMAQSDETPEQLQARLDRMNERLLKRGQASSPDGSGDSAIRAPQAGSGDVPRPAVAFGGADPRPANGRAHLSRVPPGL